MASTRYRAHPSPSELRVGVTSDGSTALSDKRDGGADRDLAAASCHRWKGDGGRDDGGGGALDGACGARRA